MKAFPVFGQNIWDNNRIHTESGGMDLRDYFAAQALTGLMVWDCTVNKEQQSFEGIRGAFRLASTAYDIAEAMIEARGKND